MTGKHKIAHRVLALVLCAVLVLSAGTTGLGGILSSELWSSLAPTVQAATANTAATLSSAISGASASGTTTIQLTGNITDLNYALPAIDDNIILDLNGYSITYSYYLVYNQESNNSCQLPTSNAGMDVRRDTFDNSIFTVAASGTLKIINTSTTNSSIRFSTDSYLSYNGTGRRTIQASTTLFNCSGTMIIGDVQNSAYNNFTIHAGSIARVATSGLNGAWGVYAYATALTITLKGNAIFKMYGGTISATATGRAYNNPPMTVRCFPLNIESCYSAEIYGGSINIPSDNECGIRNTGGTNTDAADNWFAAIRYNNSANASNPYRTLYVFDVDSTVDCEAGADTGEAVMYTANVWDVTNDNNTPFVMGGLFKNVSSKSDADTHASANYFVLGKCNRPISNRGWVDGYSYDGSGNQLYDDNGNPVRTHESSNSAAGTYAMFTMFYMTDQYANNAIWYGNYTTMADWVSNAYDATYNLHIASRMDAATYFADVDYPKTNATGNNIGLKYLYTRTAYAHSGWCGVLPGYNTPVTISGGISNAGTFGGTGGTVLIHPTWIPIPYEAYFDPNGGSYNNTTTPTGISYDIENTNEMYMPLPTRDGYTFTGWKTDRLLQNSGTTELGDWPLGEVYPQGTAMKGRWGNVSFLAQWEHTPYTITFNTDGGNAIASMTYYYDEGGTLPAAQKTGYTFQSWTVESIVDGGGTVVGETMLAGDFGVKAANSLPVWGNITLKAVYTPNTYTLSYNLNGGDGTAPDSKTVTYDAKYGTLPTASRVGYGFNGWYTAASGGDKVNADTIYKIAGDSTLYAQWKADSYSVTFYYNYGTMGQFDKIAVEYDAKYGINSAFGTPSRPGYNFAGWYTEASGGTKVTDDTIYKIAGDSSLYAHWDYATYTLTFNENGGTDVADFTYTIGDTFNLPASTRNGYSLRWIADSDAGSWKQGSQYAPGEYSAQYGTLSFTAQWTKIPYTVSLDTAGGTVNPSSVSYDVETAADLPTPSRNGYRFIRWEVAEVADLCSFTVGEDVASVAIGNYGNITLIAVWEPIEYTLTFDLHGGEYDGDTVYTYTIEDKLNIIEPTRTAYTFIQWAVKENAGNWIANEYVKPTDMPEAKWGDVTLVAQWQTIQYTMSFNSDGGSTFADRNYTVIAGAALPQSERAGYVFLGWKPDADAGNWSAATVYEAGYSIAGMHGNVAFTAQWKVDTYTATLDPNGGELAETEVEYTILADTALPTPLRNGYSFNGWRVKDYVGNWEKNAVIYSVEHGKYGNVELIGQWALNKYDASFYSQNTLQAGLTVEDYDVENGITLPSVSRDHYTFIGWQPAESVGSWDATQVYTAGDYADAWGTVQFNAVWEEYKYTVVWQNEDGTVLETDTNVSYGTVPTYDGEIPTKDADAQYTYEFSEWSPVVTAVSGANGTTYTYTAVFNQRVNSYTVTWIYEKNENGDIETVTDTFNYGEMPVFNGIPVKESANTATHVWQFTGWNPALAPVTGNATYTASFTKNTDPVTVTWYIDGVANVTYGFEGEIPAYYTTPVKAETDGYKYTFAGWSATENGEILASLPALVKGQNVAYYAIFTKSVADYTVTLRANGGTVENDSIVYNVEDAVALPVPVRNGYTFAGWKPVNAVGNWDADTVYNAGALNGMYGNVTLVAQWTATEYTLSIYPADGSANYDISYTTDGTVTLPTVTREGYTFTGWYVLLGDGSWKQGQVLDLNEVLTGNYGDLTVQAQWQINRYTVTWIIEGTSSTETYAYGAAVAQRRAPEKLGYNVAWDIGTLPQVMPAQNLVITAVYTLREYTITYNVNGGEMPDSYPVTYNITSVDALPVPSKEGSLFAGWQVVSEGGSWILNTTTAVSATLTGRYGNVALKAVWTPTIHAITWIIDGVPRIAHWYYGAMPSYDGIPTKAEDAQYTYTFSGWDKEIVKVTGDATYTALFDTADRYYTVTWMREETVLLEQTYKYGEKPEYTGVTPNKAPDQFFSYTFSGWTPEITEVTGPQTYRAEFTVYRFVQSVVLNYSNITLVNGGTVQLTASVYPVEADYPDVEWFSVDESIATVDSDGFVTAVGVGTTSICVRSLEKPELVAFCTIRVTPIYVTWLEVTAQTSTTQPIGQTIQLGYILRPDNATNLAVNWVSMDAKVAIVGTNGLVTVIGVGTTQIYCYSADGYCTGSISVTGTQDVVEDPEDEVKYVIVWFPTSKAAGGYIVNGQTIQEGTVRYVSGSDVTFKLVNNNDYTVTVEGKGAYYPDENGYYTIRNVTSDISVLVFTGGDTSLDDEITNDPQAGKSFFDKLGDFFRRIVEFFRSLFGG